MPSNKIRFFISDPLISGHRVKLDHKTSHRITTVLRLNEKDEIFVFNGSGIEYRATIEGMRNKSVTISVAEELTTTIESSLKITLILAAIKADKMAFSIQKATELGVTRIMPFFSERTLIKLNKDRQEKRHARWQNIVQSAAEQSGRRVIPDLHPVRPLTDIRLTELKADCLLLHPRTDLKINDHKCGDRPLAIICGPEGGFTDGELHELIKQDAKLINLGPRVMRAETASICALNLAQFLWGDGNK